MHGCDARGGASPKARWHCGLELLLELSKGEGSCNEGL